VIKLGKVTFNNPVLLAPMSGVTDEPFRSSVKNFGDVFTYTEMVASSEILNTDLKKIKKLQNSLNNNAIQIVGRDPKIMKEAAILCEGLGTSFIDINMGCPAKKVLKKAAGSALLKDIKLVKSIVKAVVDSVDIPVTLKIRTGWCPSTRNGVDVAKIAEDCGVSLLTVHGRTRQCRFKGSAEYETIAKIKQSVKIPIIANGDIDSPQKARQVLEYTKADGLMIGRASLGKPWIFDQIRQYILFGIKKSEPGMAEKFRIIENHVKQIQAFYGEIKGVWYSRKHIARYVESFKNSKEFLRTFNEETEGPAQIDLLRSYFANLARDNEAEFA